MRPGDLLNAASYVEPQYVFPSDMTTGTSDEADTSSFTSPVTPHSDLEPERFPRLSNQPLNHQHQYDPDYFIDPSLRFESRDDVSSKKRKVEALRTYPEASTLSSHIHIEDRGRSQFRSRSPVKAKKSKRSDEPAVNKQSQVLQRLKQMQQRSRTPATQNPTASTCPSSVMPPPSEHRAFSSKPALHLKPAAPLAPRSAPLSHPPAAAVVGRTTAPKPVPSARPFLTDKGLPSKASKSKPMNGTTNLMQPVGFATPRNPNPTTSLQQMAKVSRTPPAREDDTDDDLLESRTLLGPAKGPSQKERASAHSKTQLQASRQHNYIESSQSEILRLRKEQARLSDHHAATTTRLEGEIESLIKRIEALEIREPTALVATGVRNNAMNSAIRQVLFKMMGIEFNEALPDPMDGKDTYWTEIDFLEVDGTTTATSVLRPKWADSWTHNSKWHKSFFERFRRDASNYEPTLSQDTVKGIPDKTLRSVAGKVFKTLKEGYKEGNRPIGLQSLNVAIARREKRQIDKSKLAIEARKNIPDIGDQEYDFAFAPKWQSTDYSASDASHQSSSDEVDIVVNKRRKAYKKPKKEDIFTTHPPVWRSKDYRALSQLIKDEVEKIVAEREADKKNWMKKRVPRIQGQPRTANSLPQHNTLKTPRWAVSTRWLKSLMREDREQQEALMTDNHDADISYSESSSAESV
ncbi:hypothetical protein DEU56DRAFT_802488 [Suillus clintonianus]|uniref:uncharacterized protein n=1 Tax=Suillus clintonianus TaxID=1904413 RepID=UPI001B86B7A1|nr:uncharacterized protein DEU56DRAFT_802488 [Suillus clintonianus]KAG2138292.1 hypothetical protein DEU56DRAFT_802488 [Suillus clintonianus]